MSIKDQIRQEIATYLKNNSGVITGNLYVKADDLLAFIDSLPDEPMRCVINYKDIISPRQSCHSRLACICADVQKAKGIDPFNGRRDTVAIQWRQAIVTQLRREGYTLHQIGRATCYSHSTVLYHVGRVNDALGGYDPELFDVWREMQKAIGNENAY